MCSLYKTLTELTKAPHFWFELTHLALALILQSTPRTNPNKGKCPRSWSSLCLRPALTSLCGPSSHATYFLQDLWVLSFSISLSFVVFCWIKAHHPTVDLGLYLPNVNLTKSQQTRVFICEECQADSVAAFCWASISFGEMKAFNWFRRACISHLKLVRLSPSPPSSFPNSLQYVILYTLFWSFSFFIQLYFHLLLI